jgi:hypothetical protein
MNYLIVFLAGFLLGAITGILAYRNNRDKVEADAAKVEAELANDKAKAQELLNALKQKP